MASGSHTWNGNWAAFVNPARATRTAISVVKPGSEAQISWAKAPDSEVVPVRHQMAAIASRSRTPPTNVIRRVRIEAPSPAFPADAINRKDAKDVSSQQMNSTTRSSASTSACIERVNAVITW